MSTSVEEMSTPGPDGSRQLGVLVVSCTPAPASATRRARPRTRIHHGCRQLLGHNQIGGHRRVRPCGSPHRSAAPAPNRGSGAVPTRRWCRRAAVASSHIHLPGFSSPFGSVWRWQVLTRSASRSTYHWCGECTAIPSSVSAGTPSMTCCGLWEDAVSHPGTSAVPGFQVHHTAVVHRRTSSSFHQRHPCIPYCRGNAL